MNISDIEAGKSYGCYFRIRTFVDKDGKVIDTRKLKAGEPVEGGTPGVYEGFGIITKRDTDKELIEVIDQDLKREWVVSWDNAWDVDEINWVDTEEQ